MRVRNILLFKYLFLIMAAAGFFLGAALSSFAQDEFVAWEEGASAKEVVVLSECGSAACDPGRVQRILVIGSLLATALAGFFIRKPWGRKLRPLFLLAALVSLGFVWGGCPCPIMGGINLVLFCTGRAVAWSSPFSIIVPSAGRPARSVWCWGWSGKSRERSVLPWKVPASLAGSA